MKLERDQTKKLINAYEILSHIYIYIRVMKLKTYIYDKKVWKSWDSRMRISVGQIIDEYQPHVIRAR